MGIASEQDEIHVRPKTALQLLKMKQRQNGVLSATSMTGKRKFPMDARGTRDESDVYTLATSNLLPPKLPLLIMNENNTILSRNHQWLFLQGRGGITELSGEAGTGKTQIGLSLCITTARTELFPFQYTGDTHGQRLDTRSIEFLESSVTSKKSIGIGIGINHSHQGLQTRASQHYEAMYISMGESTSPNQIAYRLHQMTSARLDKGKSCDGKINFNHAKDVEKVMRRIRTRFIQNDEEFMDLLDNLPSLLQAGLQENSDSRSSLKGEGSRIGLIVLDSVAGLFRTPSDVDYANIHESRTPGTDFRDDEGVQKGDHRTCTSNDDFDQKKSDSDSMKSFYLQRSGVLFNTASKLKSISNTFGVNVLVLNQVTTKGLGKMVPSLGLSWSNCVNDRYFLSREEISSSNGSMKFSRKVSVMNSSRWSENVEHAFQIESAGAVLRYA